MISVLVITQLALGESQQLLQEPIAAKEQLEYFLTYICKFFLAMTLPFDTSMELRNDQTEYCKKNYFGSKDPQLPPPSKIEDWCQSKGEVNFMINPLDKWQLVILVPDDEYLLINHKFLNASETIGKLETTSENKSTIWTTVLNDDGTSSLWLRGPEVPPWSAQVEKVMCKDDVITVKIEEPTFHYIPGSRSVDVTFKWSFSKVPTLVSTIEVTNDCYIDNFINGNYTKKTIGTTLHTTTITNMVMDTECTFTIKINDNKFVHSYNTPSCYDFTAEGCRPDPEQPKGLKLEAIEANDGLGWDVEVSCRDDALTSASTPERPHRRPNSRIDARTAASSPDRPYRHSNGRIETRTAVSTPKWPHRHPNGRINARTTASTPERPYRSCSNGRIDGESFQCDNLYMKDPLQKIPKGGILDCGAEPGLEDGWEIRTERLLLHEVIGEGAFGVVRRGTLAPVGKEVAVKMLKDFPTPEEIRSFRAEMELMKSVGAHPHIVSLVGCCSVRRNPLIVAEYCSRGDLLSYLRCCWDVMVSKRSAKYYNNNLETSDYRNDLFKKPQKENSKLVVNKLYDLQDICNAELTSLDLLSFCRQIAMGMEFLASNRVVHRDLAARNVLVTGDRMLKIADFGLSRDVYQENQYKQKGNGKMPVKWMALESLTHKIYTTQSDVWSFGVVIWEVVTVGGAPYPEVSAARLPRLLRAGYRMPRPNNCSKQLYDIMMSCWRSRPRDRPTFSELHRKLDELLNSACADEYLSLELDGDETPPTPKAQRYLKVMLSKGNRVWARGESYERPLKAPQSNHYTSPPAVAPLARPQPV
ncbi:tyrosine-protein kinase receptor torso-like [Hyposmocoma kahamanoa]|uniref:tyrosine-protein kinase receptor torso-like n=1 Tax=Hyposmocoma kahamanoa TaxID=1477025 RepID=UPI000E6D5F8D|nr:tyrosine-protein kinase receptor torso-like [Hyposmocoma kahamanoa]